MKTWYGLLACLCLAGLGAEADAQVRNEGLANAIIAARQKNAVLMKQYAWNTRTEVLMQGAVKDIRIEQVNYGPDGNLQRTLLNDQQSDLPMGFWMRRIAEQERAQVEQSLQGLRGLLDQYTLPTAGKIVDFVSTAAILAPDANGLLQLTGGSVVIPGDTLSLWVDAPTRQTRRMKIMSYYQGYEVTVSATFRTSMTGLTYMSFAQVDCPLLQMSLQVQNYDFANQNF